MSSNAFCNRPRRQSRRSPTFARQALPPTLPESPTRRLFLYASLIYGVANTLRVVVRCRVERRRRPCHTCPLLLQIKFAFEQIELYGIVWELLSRCFVFCVKCPNGNKSTLERACLTRFQPRSVLFVYCNRFDNELKVRFRVISGSRSCDCSHWVEWYILPLDKLRPETACVGGVGAVCHIAYCRFASSESIIA